MSTTKINSPENIFGSGIRSARKALHLTQIEFAKPLGISGAYISDIEKGKAIPSEPVIMQIVGVYRISRNWLEFGWEPIFLDQPPEKVEEPKTDYSIKTPKRMMLEDLLDQESDEDLEKLILALLAKKHRSTDES